MVFRDGQSTRQIICRIFSSLLYTILQSLYLAFILSWTVCGLDILLVLILNPHIVEQRATKEHMPVVVGWLGNAWLHWLPPILITLDFIICRDTLRRYIGLYPLKIAFRKKSTPPDRSTPVNVSDSRPLLNTEKVPRGYGEYFSTSQLVNRTSTDSVYSGRSSISFWDFLLYVWSLCCTPALLLFWQHHFSAKDVYHITHNVSDLTMTLISISLTLITWFFWIWNITVPVGPSGSTFTMAKTSNPLTTASSRPQSEIFSPSTILESPDDPFI